MKLGSMDTKNSKNQKQTYKPAGKRSPKEQDELNVMKAFFNL